MLDEYWPASLYPTAFHEDALFRVELVTKYSVDVVELYEFEDIENPPPLATYPEGQEAVPVPVRYVEPAMAAWTTAGAKAIPAAKMIEGTMSLF
ncbi:MAG: hypothetical protein ACJ716_09630 [Marmoricola sp.]